MDKLYIVIPCYNEEENIVSVIEDWYKVLDGKSKESRLVVIDDGSKDNTFNIDGCKHYVLNRNDTVPIISHCTKAG